MSPAPIAGSWAIRGVRTPGVASTDLFITDGRLADHAAPDATQIDGTGLLALPGLVDLHTHLREPGQPEAETVATGTMAAARGGFTAVFAMANLTPATDTPERAEHVLALGEHAHAQVQPIGAITRGLAGQQLTDKRAMFNSAAHVQVFSDDGRCVDDAQVMRQGFEQVAAFGGVLAQHAQDSRLAPADACCHEGPISAQLDLPGWPSEAESTIIARDVQLARRTGGRLHVCHVSTAESVEVLRWARNRDIAVTAEVTPHHLLLTTDELVSLDTTFKVNPPLRPVEDVLAVRQALADGVIDIVATDHAPHTADSKNQAFPLAKPGMIGLEQALAVVLATMVEPGQLDWVDVARVLSTMPARIGGIDQLQGRPLMAGEPANLVLIDPSATTTVDASASLSRSRNNPYAGRVLPDPVLATWWAGRQTWVSQRLPWSEANSGPRVDPDHDHRVGS